MLLLVGAGIPNKIIWLSTHSAGDGWMKYFILG